MSTTTTSLDAATERSGSSSASRLRIAVLSVIVLLAVSLLALGLAPLLMPESYSWTEHGVSESAGQGLEQAWLARLGFIGFGLAVVGLVALRRRSWGPIASPLHLIFGVSMFGVAAFPTRPWEEGAAFIESEDLLHSIFASTMGVAFIAGVVTLLVVRRNRSVAAAIPDWVAVVVATTVPLTMSSIDLWAVLQRAMFLIAGLWYGREGWLETRRSGPTPRHPALGLSFRG